MKVLIAEDDEISRDLLVQILEKYASCDAVEDGAEAVEAFRLAWEEQQPYDLVCLDIMMPEMDGQEALKLIRLTERERGISPGSEVKVLILSALDDPRSVVEAYYRGGATSYLVKPVRLKRLHHELKQLGLLTDVKTSEFSGVQTGEACRRN